MARYIGESCRVCRREGEKLFLKGSRCYTDKCALSRRAYAPGQHGAKRKKQSEYGTQLREKQKAKAFYGVLEKQFREYFANANEWIEDGKQGKVAVVRGKWSGDENSDALLKELKITIRCLPLEQSGTEGICLLTGKPATKDVIYAKCY